MPGLEAVQTGEGGRRVRVIEQDMVIQFLQGSIEVWNRPGPKLEPNQVADILRRLKARIERLDAWDFDPSAALAEPGNGDD